MEQFIAIVVALGIKLAASPETASAVERLYAMILDALIPNEEKRFLSECLRVVQGIRADDPDFDEEQVKRYSMDAIRQLAADEGRVLDAAIFHTLGLVA